MFMGRIVNKVPGYVEAESKKEKTGYIGDLSQKSLTQLNELLKRQHKLLSNKRFIDKLPDKGEKITKFKESIEKELKKHNDSENLSNMLASLSMNSKEDLDALEWTGHCVPGQTMKIDETSDDEQDPLKILASHSGAGFHKKRHKEIKPEEPLIKPSDLVTDNSAKETVVDDLEEYAKHFCERFDSTVQPKSKFLPHRTLKPRETECAEKSRTKKEAKQWEVTAATPPPPVHGDTKLVSLQESIRLQTEQQLKLKEVQLKHAMDRLGTWHGGGMSSLPQTVGSYRDPGSRSSSDDEASEHEVHDEEYPDTGGVVIYNLVDDVNS